VAHDFNNLLTGVLGGLALVEEALSDRPDLATDVREMQKTAWRATELTKQLLGFARMGRYEPRPLDLAAIAAGTASLFARTHKDLVLEVETPREPAVAVADRTQIEQVLLNLLINASQAVPRGGKVTVRTRRAELRSPDVAGHDVPPGRFVVLDVADDGPGMDEATRARIFEPFFTTKERGEGTGLGLASVYGIASRHGGFVTVDSAPGRGATFSVHLPESDTAVPDESAPPPERARHGGSGTVLLVDDEETVLRVCTRMLEHLGYSVLQAKDGQEAVAILRQDPGRISLVILDMIMPSMTASDAFDALRAVSPGVKVLLATGYSADGPAADLLARGCNGFIHKPFSLAGLSMKIRELL
jgi:CheY-like chemotaxis protein